MVSVPVLASRDRLIQHKLDQLSARFPEDLSQGVLPQDKALAKKIIFEIAQPEEGSFSRAMLSISPRKLFDYRLGQSLKAFLMRCLLQEKAMPDLLSNALSTTKTVLEEVLSTENTHLIRVAWDRHTENISQTSPDFQPTLASLTRHIEDSYAREYLTELLQKQQLNVSCIEKPLVLTNRVRVYLDPTKVHVLGFKSQGKEVYLRVFPNTFTAKEAIFEYVRTTFTDATEKHIYQMPQ